MTSTRRRFCLLALALAACLAAPAGAASLRFYGNGVAAPTLDRVVIPLDAPARPVDVGAGDFTVEFWVKAVPGANGDVACERASDSWIFGNILFDRDVFGPGDWGDWGVSLMAGRIAFGVAAGSDGTTVCGTTDVADGGWHHVAATRRADGEVRIFVDGAADGAADGPAGDVSYRDGRSTAFPWDPYLVIGAEKHDAGAEFPSFNGWIDEVRISTTVRYTAPFPRPAAPFAPDADTAALYHLDEGSGDLVADDAGAAGGPSHGTRRFGGSPAGPEWSADTPFAAAIFADGFESGDTSRWSATARSAAP